MKAPIRVKMILQSPCDRNTALWFPNSTTAFAAARGILRDTHYVPLLMGYYGTARFDRDGSGSVAWNERSTYPPQSQTVTSFDPQTTACI